MSVFYWISFVLYLSPILKLFIKMASFVLALFRSRMTMNPFFERINRELGRLEYVIRVPRNLIFGALFSLTFIYSVVKGTLHGIPAGMSTWGFLLPALFLGLIGFTIHQEIIISLRLAEFLRQFPDLHPQTFFDICHQMRGPFPYDIPAGQTLPTVSPVKVDFKKNARLQQSAWLLIPALWDTAHLAHASLRSLRYVGTQFARGTFDVMASMWGKRMLQLFQASLQVTGSEKLENLDGKIILVLNHKSQLDFALTFFALSAIRLPSGRKIKPRFITAKDHFVDNLLVYQVLGMGKLIEAIDMVFIDRKKKGVGFQNLKQAADFLVNKEIEIAIFPQGTRAEGNVDRSEKRRDAGFYTTVPPKDAESDLGHLRKGCAFLAVDTLLELTRKNLNTPLHLVFVGISGTATTFSKQSLKIQTETDIRYDIGEPLTLTTEMVGGMQSEDQKYFELIDELHQQINDHLVESLNIHSNLKHRFLLDLKGYFRLTQDRIDHVEQYLEIITRETNLPYQILDRIYACAPKEWNPFLSELSQLLMDESPKKRFETFRSVVTQTMLEGLKTKSHGKKIKKEHLKKEQTSNG